MHEVPTSPQICASTTLGNLKWQIEPLTQYLYLHFNELLNSHNHDRQLLSQKSSNVLYVTSFLHYMLEISISSAYQDLACRQTETTHQERLSRSESHCLLNVRLATWRQRLSACVRDRGRYFDFRAHDVKMMLLATRLTIFRQYLPVVFVAIQWFIKVYM